MKYKIYKCSCEWVADTYILDQTFKISCSNFHFETDCLNKIVSMIEKTEAGNPGSHLASKRNQDPFKKIKIDITKKVVSKGIILETANKVFEFDNISNKELKTFFSQCSI